jgi:hypothetical protein
VKALCESAIAMASGNRAALIHCGAARNVLPVALGEYMEEDTDDA